MVLLLIPFVAIAGAADRQQCSRRAFHAAVASYLLIAVTIHLRSNFVDADWWAHGVRYLAEGSSVALLLGFLAAWWFAIDPSASAAAEQLTRRRRLSSRPPVPPLRLSRFAPRSPDDLGTQ
jgi:hypothetical protein